MAMNSTRRKLAIVSWAPPAEGNIHGKLVVDIGQAERFVAHQAVTSGQKVTLTHLIGKAIGLALAAAPGLNGRIFLDRYIPHDSVALAFLVALDDGADLAKVKIDHIDKKSLPEIASEMAAHAGRLRKGGDPDFEKTKGTLKLMPTFLLRPLVWLTGWLASAVGLSIPALGVERFPFGACLLTSVGMLGIDEAFAPHTPFARVPITLLVGAARDAVCVKDGQPAVRRELTLCATIDHRFVDGFEMARLAKIIRKTLEDPWTTLGVEDPARIA